MTRSAAASSPRCRKALARRPSKLNRARAAWGPSGSPRSSSSARTADGSSPARTQGASPTSTPSTPGIAGASPSATSTLRTDHRSGARNGKLRASAGPRSSTSGTGAAAATWLRRSFRRCTNHSQAGRSTVRTALASRNRTTLAPGGVVNTPRSAPASSGPSTTAPSGPSCTAMRSNLAPRSLRPASTLNQARSARATRGVAQATRCSSKPSPRASASRRRMAPGCDGSASMRPSSAGSALGLTGSRAIAITAR
jgi:hypothetical protein